MLIHVCIIIIIYIALISDFDAHYIIFPTGNTFSLFNDAACFVLIKKIHIIFSIWGNRLNCMNEWFLVPCSNRNNKKSSRKTTFERDD